MRRSILSVLFVLLIAGLAWGQRRVTVSVMDLNVTEGVSAKEAVMLTDKLLNSLVEFRVYEVVERSKRDEILKEQGFQMTGACSEASCLVEVGQLLGAQKMIGGTVGRLGNLYAVELRMIDIQTGKIDLVFSKNYSGDISNLLVAMKQAAETFSRWRPGPEGAAPKGGLVIYSKPDQAKVIVDDKEYGYTPTYVYPLDIGLHQVVILKDGYNLYSQGMTIKPGEVDTLEAVLSRTVGSLRVVSHPAGAKVYLNQEYKGKTSGQGLLVENLKLQPYLLKLDRVGYGSHREEINLDVGQEKKVEIALKPKHWWLSLDGGLIAQGVSGNLKYGDIAKVGGQGGSGPEYQFGILLGRRLTKNLSAFVGWQYHTAYAGNDSLIILPADPLYVQRAQEVRMDFALPAIAAGAQISTSWGRFEPYAEVRYGFGMPKPKVKEKVEYSNWNSSGPIPQSTDNEYDCQGYTNFQAGIGGKVWFNSTVAFIFSFQYNYERIKEVPNSFHPRKVVESLTSWNFSNYWGLEFAW